MVLENEFGQLLRNLRNDKSLREVERLSGVSHVYLSFLEKGADPRSGKRIKPSLEILNKISKIYDYPYFELLQKAGYKQSEIDFLNKIFIIFWSGSFDDWKVVKVFSTKEKAEDWLKVINGKGYWIHEMDVD